MKIFTLVIGTSTAVLVAVCMVALLEMVFSLRAISTNHMRLHQVARFINVGECNYIATDHPFTLTHKGDCTNHVVRVVPKTQ